MKLGSEENSWDKILEQECGYIEREEAEPIDDDSNPQGWTFETQMAMKELIELNRRSVEKRMWYAERYTEIVEEEKKLARQEKLEFLRLRSETKRAG